MNINKFNIPTIANNSETRDNGRRQWLLVNRNATETRGAAPVTMKTIENTAM